MTERPGWGQGISSRRSAGLVLSRASKSAQETFAWRGGAAAASIGAGARRGKLGGFCRGRSWLPVGYLGKSWTLCLSEAKFALDESDDQDLDEDLEARPKDWPPEDPGAEGNEDGSGALCSFTSWVSFRARSSSFRLSFSAAT
mmetsp:Transcript_30945/g.69494  ORF Transcript_30945/g.69494 Transcript_30945/m.69494 type:complete len:143 (+) Transcript_30945:364-792(+)